MSGKWDIILYKMYSQSAHDNSTDDQLIIRIILLKTNSLSFIFWVFFAGTTFAFNVRMVLGVRLRRGEIFCTLMISGCNYGFDITNFFWRFFVYACLFAELCRPRYWCTCPRYGNKRTGNELDRWYLCTYNRVWGYQRSCLHNRQAHHPGWYPWPYLGHW